MTDFLQNTYFLYNSLDKWLIALGIFLGTSIIFQIVQFLIKQRVSVLAKKTETPIDDLVVEIVQQTKLFFILVIALWVSYRSVLLGTEDTYIALRTLTFFALFIQIGYWGNGLITYMVDRQVKVELAADEGANATTINALGLVLKGALWSIVILLALDNLPGVEINSLIASMGITGIAVALAVQNILGDLFAALSIVLDKPFVIGDFIVVGDLGGSVEHIGLKSTRLRSLSGEQLIFSNSDLLGSRIRNYKRMERRRQVFSFGVTYQTPPAKLSAIPAIVQDIIASHEQLTFDRVHLQQLAASSIDFEAVYTMETPDYNAFMDTQQSINLRLIAQFEKEGIEFAYPTQTVFVER